MSRVVVGMTGASGAAVALQVLELLKQTSAEVHLVVSKWGAVNLEHECGITVRSLRSLVHTVHSDRDLAAPLSSGSFRCESTLIVPCSARTLGAVANGSGDTLISRAADVAIKERRRLVLALREAPLSSIHLRNALQLSDAGAVVYPLVPTFYANPGDVDQLTEQIAAKLVDLCGFETPALPRWSESVDLTRKTRTKNGARGIPSYDASPESGNVPE